MIPQAKKTAIIKMLAENKYSLRKISMVTGVSWGTVKAFRDGQQKVRKHDNLPVTMRKKAKPRICPKCGSRVIVWPCIACNPNHFQDYITLHPNIYKDISNTQKAKEQLPALLCLANDLQELAALNQINNILFASLVTRAQTIFNLILKNGKNNDET